ncbi:MAG: 6,7-dimethyl-8-ribityllumazine synthase [Candidatus Omnitrophica bacterium]|nr:6,7-dimethyl-8-ribityllumazine synthase [Candidatus Omnitrophota bacterium]
MTHIFEGEYSARGLKIGIIASRFNEAVTKVMVEGALNELRRLGASETDLYVMWIPGAYEIPLACQSFCESKKPDAIVAIGCIIRGETSHYEHIAQSVCDGLQKVALEQAVPVGLAVLTVETMAQALDRAGGKHGNKARDAARSAVEMARLIQGLKNREDKQVQLKELLNREFRKP